ncbi:hypothetical protein CHS0354_030851 [Potamilus streckersoni]|uniref:Uncharacterized protein n=1 Tax=Potamilus streckersoni TaxID=2493646 RepID=A0AAE0SRH9_9BIVA|nr:hypothetical protein CHS0354_030851 [Potamilus streckersoni]
MAELSEPLVLGLHPSAWVYIGRMTLVLTSDTLSALFLTRQNPPPAPGEGNTSKTAQPSQGVAVVVDFTPGPPPQSLAIKVRLLSTSPDYSTGNTSYGESRDNAANSASASALRSLSILAFRV